MPVEGKSGVQAALKTQTHGATGGFAGPAGIRFTGGLRRVVAANPKPNSDLPGTEILGQARDTGQVFFVDKISNKPVGGE